MLGKVFWAEQRGSNGKIAYWEVLHVKSRKMGQSGHVVRVEDRRNSYKVLVGKTEGNRPLGRHM
jgi:hypothetical protein